MLTPGKGLPLPRIEPATRPEPGLQAEHASHRAIGSPSQQREVASKILHEKESFELPKTKFTD